MINPKSQNRCKRELYQIRAQVYGGIKENVQNFGKEKKDQDFKQFKNIHKLEGEKKKKEALFLFHDCNVFEEEVPFSYFLLFLFF